MKCDAHSGGSVGTASSEAPTTAGFLRYKLMQTNASPKSWSGQRVPAGQQRQPSPPLLQMLSPAPQQASLIKTPPSTAWQQLPPSARQLSQNRFLHVPSSMQVSRTGSQHSLPHGTYCSSHTHHPFAQVVRISQHVPAQHSSVGPQHKSPPQYSSAGLHIPEWLAKAHLGDKGPSIAPKIAAPANFSACPRVMVPLASPLASSSKEFSPVVLCRVETSLMSLCSGIGSLHPTRYYWLCNYSSNF